MSHDKIRRDYFHPEAKGRPGDELGRVAAQHVTRCSTDEPEPMGWLWLMLGGAVLALFAIGAAIDVKDDLRYVRDNIKKCSAHEPGESKKDDPRDQTGQRPGDHGNAGQLPAELFQGGHSSGNPL